MNVNHYSASFQHLTCELLVIALQEGDPTMDSLNALFEGHLSAWSATQQFKGKSGEALLVPGMGFVGAKLVLLVGVGDGSNKNILKAMATAGRKAREKGCREIGLVLPGQTVATSDIIEMLQTGNYSYQRYQREDKRKPALETLLIPQERDLSEQTTRYANIRSRWQYVCRDLINDPAADLYPESLAQRAQQLAEIPGVEVQVLDIETCKQKGYVGIVAVGQGSPRAGCMIHLTYRPTNANGHIALVGKGVTFDSGGLSLKPSAGMQTMRCDMGGAATVLGAFGAAAEQGLPIKLDCIIGAVENMTGGNAYKLGDILKYQNGVTVEIHNTDAEGRLVLADCLLRASDIPGVTDIIDAATLTGASVVALGSSFSGLFTNDKELADELLGAAADNQEGLWQLPLHDPYKSELKGQWGQIKNVGGREAGASTAALFLQHFVTGARWAHLDIAGPAFMDKPKGFYEAGGTGSMVRALSTWIERRSAAS